MLAKMTVKNQITLPKKIVGQFPRVEYFDVRREDDRIVLEPLRQDKTRQVRKKLAALRIAESDIADAVAWARKAKG
ncbi:MAG: AbrB/MazE/SpoVT family DNA-binding domain-containing protein [Nitrospirae bacterium]|nr:AbrB/MazE/SpoVT family DNA-binding domain-containing protein [Nitrospirota bacterium]MBI3393281.1 AbrB/MazE/SpoVT family DNA-binding domain-containing protein [Nitrospirota bacterium]